MTKIARNIKTQRKKLQVSQEELAEKLYVTRQTISNYENGKSNPDLETLQQIADILETDMDFLLYGEHKPRDKKAIKKHSIILGLCLLIVIAVLIIYNYEMLTMGPSYRSPSISWFMHILGYPILLVISGASMTKLIMLLTASTPLKMKYKKVVNKSILFLFIAYCISLLPNAIIPVIINIHYYTSYSFNGFGTGLTRIYTHHFLLFEHSPILFGIFGIIGCILALTASAPENKKKLRSVKNSNVQQ